GSRLPGFLLLPAKILGIRPGKSVGAKFSPSDFYSAALGMALSSAAVPGTRDPRVLLDRLQSLPKSALDDDHAAKLVEIVRKKSFILDSLEAATISGGTPNYNEVAAAFSTLGELPQAETGFVTAII